MKSLLLFFILITLLAIPASAGLTAPTSYSPGYKIFGHYWDCMGFSCIQNGSIQIINLTGDSNGNVNASGTNITYANNLQSDVAYNVYACRWGVVFCAENTSTHVFESISANASVVANYALANADVRGARINGNIVFPSPVCSPSNGTIRINGGLKIGNISQFQGGGLIQNCDFVNGNENIRVIFESGYVDGNFSWGLPAVSTTHTVYFNRVNNIKIINGEVRNPYHSALRFDNSNNIQVIGYNISENESIPHVTGQNGIWLMDSSHATLTSLTGQTDDDFIAIDANLGDVSDIVVSGVNARSRNANLFRLDTGVVGNSPGHTMRALKLDAIGHDIGDSGIIFGCSCDSPGYFSDISFNLMLNNVTFSMVQFGENASNLLVYNQISGKVVGNKSNGHGILINTSQNISGLDLNVQLYNIASGKEAIRVLSNLSRFSLTGSINYSNTGKGNVLHDIDFQSAPPGAVRDGTINMDIVGGNRAIWLGNASNVTVRGGSVIDSISYAVLSDASAQNNIITNVPIHNATDGILLRGTNEVQSQNWGTAGYNWGIQTSAPPGAVTDDEYTNKTSHLKCYKVNSTTFVNLQNWTSVGC